MVRTLAGRWARIRGADIEMQIQMQMEMPLPCAQLSQIVGEGQLGAGLMKASWGLVRVRCWFS
jgi:hypothetical protein